ncbi:hypothetical protein KCP69_05705 [Salmonella enterica subsp. enterica]|nr:hypothetical protein KCP69_05705 [Salmonella enterica subsp. enterica]
MRYAALFRRRKLKRRRDASCREMEWNGQPDGRITARRAKGGYMRAAWFRYSQPTAHEPWLGILPESVPTMILRVALPENLMGKKRWSDTAGRRQKSQH